MARQWWHGWRLPKRGRWQLELPQLNERGYVNLGMIAHALKQAAWLLMPCFVLPLFAGLTIKTAGVPSALPSSTTGPFLGPVYNIRNYGAIGDGVANDTAAIVAAFTAAPLGATVYAPPGTYAHTAIIWNRRVNLVGDSSQGSTFLYTPTTGTAWTINPANNVNQPDTFRFFGVGFNGSGSGNATTCWNVACDYFDISYGSTQNFGTGLTFGNNAFFLNFFETNWQLCNQLLIYPTGLSGSGENIRFNGCTFVNASTFANGVQIDGIGELFFYLCSFDGTQVSLSRAGAMAFIHGAHFETVNPLNPAVPFVKQTAGILVIHGAQVLIGSAAVAMPQFASLDDSGDSGNTKAYLHSIHAFTGAGTAAFITLSNGVHVRAEYDIQGNWANDVSGATTGTMILSTTNNRTFKTNGGFVGQLSNQADTTLVTGVDASLAGEGCTSTITAARAIGALLNPTKGQRFTYTLIQGGAGGFAITWNAVYKVSWSDTGNTTGKRSSISFIYDGTNWNQDGAQTPYV